MWVSRSKSVVICIQGRCSNTGIHLAFRPGCHFVAATRDLHISLIYGALPLLCSTVLYGRSAENKLNRIMGDVFFFVLMCKLLLYQLFSKRERFTIPLNEFYASIAKLCLARKLSLCENTAQEQLCWECSDLNWPATVVGQTESGPADQRQLYHIKLKLRWKKDRKLNMMQRCMIFLINCFCLFVCSFVLVAFLYSISPLGQGRQCIGSSVYQGCLLQAFLQGLSTGHFSEYISLKKHFFFF